MRQSVIAAWVLVGVLFAVMSLGAHLPVREPALPPGVTIPSASATRALPADEGCGGGDFVALRGC